MTLLPVTGLSLDAERLAKAYYNVTRRRMPFLPPWRDPKIEDAKWEKAIADGVEIAAEYARLSETKDYGPGESKTVFRFEDGSVGPGTWNPKTGRVEKA